MTAKLTERQRALINGLLTGKEIWMNGSPFHAGDSAVLAYIANHPEDLDIAPEVVVTRLYGRFLANGEWSDFSYVQSGEHTHYMEIDSTGKQVTPITKLEEV